MRRIKGAVEIDIHQRVPYFGSKALHGPIRSIDAARDHQNIDFSKLLESFLCKLLHIFGVRGVGASHLEGLGSVEGVAREKAELVRSLPAEGFCVLNADCRWTTAMRGLTLAMAPSQVPETFVAKKFGGDGVLVEGKWYEPGRRARGFEFVDAHARASG